MPLEPHKRFNNWELSTRFTEQLRMANSAELFRLPKDASTSRNLTGAGSAQQIFHRP